MKIVKTITTTLVEDTPATAESIGQFIIDHAHTGYNEFRAKYPDFPSYVDPGETYINAFYKYLIKLANEAHIAQTRST